MFRIVTQSLGTGILTRKDPFADRPPFGFPVVDFAACTSCDACVAACSTGALKSDAPAPGVKTLTLSYASCIQCRDCVDACGDGAVRLGRDFDLAVYTREQMARRATFDLDAGGRATLRAVDGVPHQRPPRLDNNLFAPPA